MAGPGDALFESLAQAKARPSKALRAVQSAGEAGEGILGGYLEGKELGQKLEQYRLLNTPLGSMYADPSQIPFGLSPSHTVKDLLTLAPAMENYVPSNLISGAAKAYGANVSDGSVPPPPPLNTQPTPSPTPGTTDLNAIGGAGVGTQDNVPPGTPVPVPPPPSQAGGPTLNVPPGGMGLKGFQNVVLPALKAGQEERQFNERQGAEESRFQRGQAAEESRFQRGHIATSAEKVGSSLETLSGLNQFIQELDPLVSNNHPAPFIGTIGGNIARQSGGYGTPSMVNAMKIDDTAGKASALLDKQLAGRFNQQEADLLKKVMVPTGKDQGGYNAQGQPNYGQDKLNKLKAFSNALNSGNEQIIRNMASAMTGGAINVIPPTSPVNTSKNFGTGDPLADAAIQRIQSSNLSPQEKQARIQGITAKSHARRSISG